MMCLNVELQQFNFIELYQFYTRILPQVVPVCWCLLLHAWPQAHILHLIVIWTEPDFPWSEFLKSLTI